ncbi:MAG: AAA family ATPase [Candidatus Aminicenantes bacterium]|nr:AAA family ATPase [Candidatus Aminicenantes bacterium]
MLNKSKLVKMEIYNLGCIGPEGLSVDLDDLLCLVGPNNTGKSTVLRAYELAVSNQKLKEDDKCKRSAETDNSKVILYVHIPQGIPNIDERWKFPENDYLLVKSKWEWDSSGNPKRQTFDPQIGNFSEIEKASGLDQVFSSRLPKPFRIGALEDPTEEHRQLLNLILQPISEKLKRMKEDETSDLSKALLKVSELTKIPVNEEKSRLETLKKRINISHNLIFPNLEIDFDIKIGNIDFDPIKLLLANSILKFYEWSSEISWEKQGTGSQRALFWAMMQVRSELKAAEDIKKSIDKEISDKNKEIKKLEDTLKKEKKEEKKTQQLEQLSKLKVEIEEIKQKDSGAILRDKITESILPGYMLLIDEPEVALHPNAIRAASGYLYNLSEDENWQVMLTTHSPAFINPLEDHTTIVRLDRNKENPTPKTFRSDDIQFDDDEKENLKLLNRFDLNLSEMFFGQYPIIVEGDTEYAGFEYIMANNQDDYEINERPIIIRGHGKYSIVLIIRILSHFKVNFSVLHDSDFPLRSDGKKNNAWSANKQIFEAIQDARKIGLNVIHRVSIPYFELEHIKPEKDDSGQIINADSKDKPWHMISKIKNNEKVQNSVKSILDILLNAESEPNPFGDDIIVSLEERLKDWADKIGITDPRISK